MTSSNRKKLIMLTSWDLQTQFDEDDVILGKSSGTFGKSSGSVGKARRKNKREGWVGEDKKEGGMGGVSDDVIEKIKK